MEGLATKVTQDTKEKGLLHTIADFPTYKHCVETLSSHKAPGPDAISNDLLKAMPVEFHKELHHILVTMWKERHTPDHWKHSHTVLIHKKGSPLELNNYRPIALASTLYKLWTRLIHVAAYTYAEQHGVLSGGQAGFRQGHSTMSP